jgi:hypothetical protein
MVYISNSELGNLAKKTNCKQRFYPNRKPFVGATPVVVAEALADNKFTSEELELVKFIYDNTISTEGQLKVYCGKLGVKNPVETLNKLFVRGIIAKFFVADTDKVTDHPSDMAYFYCLSMGGKYLIDDYYEGAYINWSSHQAVCSPKIIYKTILATEFSLQLLLAVDYKVDIESRREFNFVTRTSNKELVASNVIRIAKPEEKKWNNAEYMITDCFLALDNQQVIYDRLRQYDALVCTQAWKKFMGDTRVAPFLLFFAESDNHSYEYAKYIAESTRITNVGFTTLDRLRKGLSDDTVITVYNKESGDLEGYPFYLCAKSQ